MHRHSIKAKSIFAAALATLTIISQTGCSQKADPVMREAYYLDTVCSVTIYAMPGMTESAANDVIDGAYGICEHYERLLSKTVKGSDIYNINHAAGKPVECDPDTISVIKKGLYYCELSAGRFDITIGQVTDLWDFHALDPKLPEDADIGRALTHVAYGQIVIEGDTVTMKDPEGEIDLGAIAKGYIADRMSEYMRKRGVTGSVVDLGGNLSVVGYKDGESREIRVGIKKPFTQTGELVAALPVHDKSIVTSGTYERYFEIDGRRYHHILDVNTGYPADTDIESVTVIGPGDRGADCDALATVSLIMGCDEAADMIEGMEGFEAVFLTDDGSIRKTGGVEGLEIV